MTQYSHNGYIATVKTVGIRMLKDNLSGYLRQVRAGEIVLVKDHNEIVAELKRPSMDYGQKDVRQFIEIEAKRGRLVKARKRQAYLPDPKTLSKPEISQKKAKEIYDYVRSER